MKRIVFIALLCILYMELNSTVLHPYLDGYFKENSYSIRGGVECLFAMLPAGIDFFIDDLHQFRDYDSSGVPFYLGGVLYYPYPSIVCGYMGMGMINNYREGINWNEGFIFEFGGEYTFPSGISIRTYGGIVRKDTDIYFFGVGIGGWATLDIFTLN